jgi:uncharacterized protein (UPF0261 family)
MKKNIVLVGTADTKGEQLQFLKDRMEKRGHQIILMDISMGGTGNVKGDISPEEIAGSVGKDMAELTASRDRMWVTDIMTRGAIQTAMKLLSEDRLQGIVALGGVTIALVGARIMDRLPFGIPKIIATPAAMPVYVGRWFVPTNMVVMQMIMEVAGMNDLVKSALAQAAGAISGMVEEVTDHKKLTLPAPSVAVTELGFSDACAKNVERLLTEKGYHVYPFHANGTSDKAMDRLIAQGFFDAVVEIVPAGLVEAKFKGNRAAGMERLDAGLDRGIPQVWAPCCLNLTGVGPTRHNREKYMADGRIFEIDQMRAMTRFPEDELLEGARMYAEKMSKAKGPLKMVVPSKGWSSIDREGSVLYDPETDQVFMNELKKHLTTDVPILTVDCNLEDLPTAQAIVNSLDQMMKEKS